MQLSARPTNLVSILSWRRKSLPSFWRLSRCNRSGGWEERCRHCCQSRRRRHLQCKSQHWTWPRWSRWWCLQAKEGWHHWMCCYDSSWTPISFFPLTNTPLYHWHFTVSQFCILSLVSITTLILLSHFMTSHPFLSPHDLSFFNILSPSSWLVIFLFPFILVLPFLILVHAQ